MSATVGGLTVPAAAGTARLDGDRFGSLLVRAGAEQPLSARVEADTVNVIAGTGRAAPVSRHRADPGGGVGLDRGSSALAAPTLTRLTVTTGPDVGPDRATGSGPVRDGVDLVARG
ncbi:hypothetical protein [Frankia sp. AgB32]|uniref:hypothetical protein n=1 Tax=Frankia sp. AgB32 TaxID=631119 RepID=UPI0020106152|nr:hypothetical protein [Frankia sp. AgB32]MCK9895647.1 hypothetical protein [Frankia sp. AgB32]